MTRNLRIYVFIYRFWSWNQLTIGFFPLFDPMQLFFDDSARNIASGKAAGLNTVIVSYNLLYIHLIGKFKKNGSTIHVHI